MSNAIQLKRSNAAGAVPSSLADGEVAIQQADGALFWRTTANVIRRLLLPRRAAVADAAYQILATDTYVGVSSLTASRILTLPAAYLYPLGHKLVVADESGAASPSRVISVQCGGGDYVNGTYRYVIAVPFASVTLVSDGVNRWTAVASGVQQFTQTDEDGALATPLIKKVRQSAFFGDRNSITGNGTSDDTAAAQAEITFASANGIRLHIPDGMAIGTTAPLNVSGWTRIYGRGGQLMKNGNNPNALGPYTGFAFNHRGVGLSCISAAGNFDRVDFRDFVIVRPQPASTYGNAWAPNADDYDIDLQRVGGRIDGVWPFRSKNFLRIQKNVGNYVNIDHIEGQVFGTGIQVLSALDNVEIGDVHFWPSWTAGPSPNAQPVLLYQLANMVGAHILRADGLKIENLFTYAASTTVLLDYNNLTDGTGGVCNNGTFGKIYNDNGAAAITCSNTSANQIFFRGNIVESYGAARTAQDPSGNTVAFYTGQNNIIDLSCTNSHIDVANFWSNNASGGHAWVRGSSTILNFQRFIEGAWGGGNANAPGVAATAGQIQIRDWQRYDGTTSPFSNFGSTPYRFATSGAGGVIGKLSSGITTVVTNSSGYAYWPHNAGCQPNIQRARVISGGAGAAVQYYPSSIDSANIGGYFYTASGSPVASQSDVVVEWETHSGV